MNELKQASGEDADKISWPRILGGMALVAVVITVTVLFGENFKLQTLARHESELRQMRLLHPVIVYGVALLVYISLTGLSVPVASVLTLLCGWYFGFWRGVVIVSFGSTTGATLAFLTSRYLLGDFVRQWFGDRLQRMNEEFRREGAFYLLTLRLMPVVPYAVINLVMGLTPIRVRTFWWVSQLGMLPLTMVYVYAGSVAPDLRTLAEHGVRGLPVGRIALAFVFIGMLPLVTRLILRRFRGRDGTPAG